MRMSFVLAGLVLVMQSFAMAADKISYPYEAIVVADDGEDVWCGPDTKKYYPTSHLNKGDRVKVFRSDPGGWCMIAPPAGSFSWVRDINVARNKPDSGAIKANRTIVHVGSDLQPNEFLIYQAELNQGDAIEILAEREFRIDGEEPRKMFKIPSPRGEKRWIKRKSITPANAYRAEPLEDEPAPKKRGPIAENDSDSPMRPVSIGTPFQDEAAEAEVKEPVEKSEKAPVDATEVGESRRKLYEIDGQFREMVKQEPISWDLDAIEDQYKQLDADYDQPALALDVGRRLESVKRHRKIQGDYSDFHRLVTTSKERDAQLLTQQGAGPMLTPSTPDRPIVGNGNPTPLAQQAAPQTSGNPALTPTPAAATSPNPQPGAAQQFDGAGIVRRLQNSFNGGPQFVLVSPDERVLCILQPTPGVDLNRYNGKPMGVIGQRYRREEWNMDVINVRGLQPVQLRKN